MTQEIPVSSTTLSEENKNKVARINQLHSEIESSYHITVDAANDSIAKETTIKKEIQKVAFAYEEIYKLHEQEWMIHDIGSLIVKDLKVRGFPESKYLYVYKALDEYGNRFVKPIEHSSMQSLDVSSKAQELFYRTNARKYYEAVDVIKGLKYDYEYLTRRDIQTIVPILLDLFDENEKVCKAKAILLEKNRQEGFDGGPEKYQDAIRINKGIPRVPVKMSEELGIWINSFLPALLKKFTDYPIEDAKLEMRMAGGWAALRLSHSPTIDDKYRKSYYDWITIVQFADSSFKHHAASKFKTQDFGGRWRKLTREQIGARQKSMKDWCKWFFETIPGFMEEIAWTRNYRDPLLADFSTQLSPKLSDRSIR